MSEQDIVPNTEQAPAVPAEQQQPAPVTFSAEQQAKIDEIVRKAMGRAASETRKALETANAEKTRLSDELKTAQEELSKERQGRQDAERREIAFRRAALITDAALAHNFVDGEALISLTERHFPWNEQLQRFDVVDHNGQVLNMSPSEFFAAFGAQRPYLLKSDVKLGAGAQSSSRSGLPTRESFKVEQIFGKGSNSRLANELARKNPIEYGRLKVEAKAKGLI